MNATQIQSGPIGTASFAGPSTEWDDYIAGMNLYQDNRPDTDCANDAQVKGWWDALQHDALTNPLQPQADLPYRADSYGYHYDDNGHPRPTIQ